MLFLDVEEFNMIIILVVSCGELLTVVKTTGVCLYSQSKEILHSN